MRQCRATGALAYKFWENSDVANVTRSDECLACRVGELGEALHGLLCGGEGAVDVDFVVGFEVCEGEGEGVVRWCEVGYADCRSC